MEAVGASAICVASPNMRFFFYYFKSPSSSWICKISSQGGSSPHHPCLSLYLPRHHLILVSSSCPWLRMPWKLALPFFFLSFSCSFILLLIRCIMTHEWSPHQALELCPIICRGGILLGTPNKDSYFGLSILSSMVAERKSKIKGDEFAFYVVPDNNCWYYFINLNAFWTGSRRLDLAACPMFWVDYWIRHMNYNLSLSRASTVSREATREKDGKILIEYCILFILDFYV